MTEKNKIEVFIGGKVYKILGEESEEYMQMVAKYIDKKMMEISSSQRSAVLNSTMVSVLTSINVADEYFKLKRQNEMLLKQLEELNIKLCENSDERILRYERDLEKLKNENIELKSKLEEVTIELDNAKNELNQYMENFDKDI